MPSIFGKSFTWRLSEVQGNVLYLGHLLTRSTISEVPGETGFSFCSSPLFLGRNWRRIGFLCEFLTEFLSKTGGKWRGAAGNQSRTRVFGARKSKALLIYMRGCKCIRDWRTVKGAQVMERGLANNTLGKLQNVKYKLPDYKETEVKVWLQKLGRQENWRNHWLRKRPWKRNKHTSREWKLRQREDGLR